jgi:hypothetical protein
MESHRVGMVAREAGISFLVIRAVADTFDRSIPQSAIGVIGKDGSPLYLKAIAGLLARPGDFPKLMQLSRDTEAALARLRRVALIVAPLFRRV